MKRYVRPLQFAASFAILAYLIHKIPLANVWASLARARVAPIVLAGALVLVAELVNAWRLKILTDRQGFSVGVWKLFEINLVSRFYRLFMPGGMLASMALRTYKLQKAERRRAEAVSSIIVDRFTFFLGLGLVGVPFWFLDQPERIENFGLMMAASLCAVLAAFAFLLGRTTGRWVQAVADRVPFAALSGAVRSCLAALAEFRRFSPGHLALIVLLAVAPHLFGIFVYGFLAAALGIPIGFATWAWMRPMIILITMLPVSVAGLGVREWALVYLLGIYAVAEEDAVALAFLVLGATVLLTSLIGGLLEGRAILSPRRLTESPR